MYEFGDMNYVALSNQLFHPYYFDFSSVKRWSLKRSCKAIPYIAFPIRTTLLHDD
ncbi:hypothetical protein VHP8226_01034 [Vibrio hippocampi]|uniref:Uncharacterized protein n=1 Tax=Vibrio hippocampi TaxID=654686 RepID=A0ABM8ZFU9_9VIBR|nr:hypothetical protein VHP8226_01034 [Vibrio hippocampi]